MVLFLCPFFSMNLICTHLNACCTREKRKFGKIQSEGHAAKRRLNQANWRRCELFNNNPYFNVPQGQAFPRPAYQQPMPMYQPQQTPPAMMQDGMVSARFVSGREEAVASNVMPGSMFLFYDRANRMIYAKLIDPQTGMPEFREFAEMQPVQQNAPQYVTPDALAAFGQELEQRFERRLEALQSPKQSSRKAVTTDD